MPYILNSPDMQADPYPAYAAMRAEPGAAWVQTRPKSSPRPFFTRYEDVVGILKDTRFINDARRLPGAEDWTRKWYMPPTFKHFGNSLALVDDPDHARLRRLVHKAFTPGMVGEMAGSIRTWAGRALDACADKPVVDLLADYALPVPLNVISDLVGVAIPDRLRFRRWMSNNVSDFSSDNALQTAMKLVNTFQLDAFLTRLIAERRAHPLDDLTSALVAVEDEGETLSGAELIAMLFIILFAGHETTVNLIASGTLALLQNPEQFALLKANPELIDSAIEELLRYTNPVQHIAIRYASQPLEVAG
jgi:cytochrome P450 PksS